MVYETRAKLQNSVQKCPWLYAQSLCLHLYSHILLTYLSSLTIYKFLNQGADMSHSQLYCHGLPQYFMCYTRAQYMFIE